MAEQTGAPEPAEPADRDVVQSLVRGLAVVRAFDAEHPTLALDQAAQRTGYSRSATRRLLRTLMAAGLVAFDGRQFRLTSRLLDLGYAQQSRLTLAEVALPHCKALSRQLGRTVSLARLDGTEVVYLARVGMPRNMDVSLTIGSRLPAHLPAVGRVLLAWLPEDALAEFLTSETYHRHVARTLRSTQDLRDQLLAIRAAGWCQVSEELEDGLSAMAAPIHDRTGRVVAAINLSTRTGGDTPAGELVEAVPDLQRTAARIGMDLHPSHLT